MKMFLTLLSTGKAVITDMAQVTCRSANPAASQPEVGEVVDQRNFLLQAWCSPLLPRVLAPYGWKRRR